MSLPWTVKHSPKSSAEVPQPKAVSLLRDFLQQRKKRGAILAGPTGSCKTSAVYAVAAELGLEVFESNASDFRDAEGVKQRLGLASRQASLFSRGKVILVDEVDALSGTKDRGGLGEIVKVIDGSSFPIVLTCSDCSDSKFSALRRKCVLIDFPAVDTPAMVSVLKGICSRESIVAEDVALRTLCLRSGGDMRAAINDLQVFAPKLSLDAIRELSGRDREESIPSSLIKVLKNSDPAIARTAFDDTGAEPGEVALWLEDALPAEYRDAPSLARAFDALSRADVFRGRIMNRQHWRFLSYVFDLLSAGVAVAKDARSPGLSDYGRPKRPLSMWIVNQRFAQRKAIAEKLADFTHTSVRGAIQHTIPFVKARASRDPDFARFIAASLSLSEEESAWLVK